jgi:uncharacterized protein YdhG (YjbR/CyaY superfamily)
VANAIIGITQAKQDRTNDMDTSTDQFKTIDEYIGSFPEKVRDILQALRQTIKEEVPEVQETIRYKMPTFMLNGTYLIYFAAWKKHISLYPYTSAMEASFIEAAAYKTSGKGTIQFPIDQPLPLPLIRKIVRFRVKENLESENNK